RPDNVRVNQDCSAFLQGEEWVDLNPTDPSNLVVSQNDQQSGYNQTSVSPSLNNGNDFFRNYTPPGLNHAPTTTGGQFAYPRCGGYCESPIHFFKSSDGGVTWSPRKQISGSNPAICNFSDAFNPHLPPHKCNFSQGSYPVVERDGSIDVVFNNGNTPTLVGQ